MYKRQVSASPDATVAAIPGDEALATPDADSLVVQGDDVPANPDADASMFPEATSDVNERMIPDDGDPTTSSDAAPGSGRHLGTLLGVLIT